MSDDRKTGTPKDSHYARLRRAHRRTEGRADEGERPAVGPRPRPGQHQAVPAPEGQVRLYGLHTVRAALDNPARRIGRMLATRNALSRLGIEEPSRLPFLVEIVEPRDIDRILGPEAVHQGAMIEAAPLKPKRLSALADTPLILVLDQVTDPHNVGAILRSGVAFAGGFVALAFYLHHATGVGGLG